jgi:Ran GTPase-activating protein (RanGAP) involved in mRNA processing and transport
MSFHYTSLLRPTPPPWLEELCQKLQDNDPTLVTLDLSHPRLDDRGARLVAAALTENRLVDTVILSGGEIVDDGAHSLGQALAKHSPLRKLQFRDLRHARELHIFFRQLALGPPQLQELSLRHCRLDHSSMESMVHCISQQAHLVEVRLVDSQLDEGAPQVLLQGLSGHSSLTRLSLIHTGLTVAHVPDLAALLTDSRSYLQDVHLCENELGDDGVAALAARVVPHNTTCYLSSLNLRSNGITSAGALSLTGLLVGAPTLTTLDVSHNTLGDLGAAALARGLRGAVLGSLDVAHNDLGSAAAAALATLLRTNPSLTHINLSWNALGDDGATALADSLTRNHRLQSLALRRCGIGNPGAMTIAKALPHMSALKQLILLKNEITHEGSLALLQGLRDNVELEYLPIDDKAADPMSREICHWLRLNKAGRRILRQTVETAALWPQVYSRIAQDTDILFHFLKETPHVVEASGSAPPRKRKHT